MIRKSIFPIWLTLLLAVPSTWAQEPPKGFEKPDQTVRIKTLEAQMKYDVGEITVRPGAKVKLVLENIDSMPHNLVVAKPQEGDPKGLELAKEAWAMAEAGFDKEWIPDSPRIIAYTKLVDPKKEQAIYFKAPNEEGDYPYVCTIPGHAMVMNGVMHVTTARSDLFDLNYRVYEGSWDKLPDFDQLKPVSAGEVPSAKIDISVAKKNENFGVRWVGKIEIRKAGEYSFQTNSDDGSKLMVGDKVVVDNDGIHPASAKQGKVSLNPGEHTVTVDYFEKGGEESLGVWWSGPGFSNRPLSVAPKGGGNNNVQTGLPIASTDGEAVIYRNFIEGASARGIGVGYPGGVNICFDADQMTVAMVWQGMFIDAKRHWTGRGQGYQPPAGYGIIPAGKAAGVAVLESKDSPWPPAGTRADGVRFVGYRLDKKRFPTFLYEIAGVHVEDRCEPMGDLSKGAVRLNRKVSFSTASGGKAPSGLHLRIASGNIKADDTGKDRFWIAETGRVTVPGAVLRGNDLIVPVDLNGGKAEISVLYDWGL